MEDIEFFSMEDNMLEHTKFRSSRVPGLCPVCAIVLVAGLVVAGCGGGDDGTDAGNDVATSDVASDVAQDAAPDSGADGAVDDGIPVDVPVDQGQEDVAENAPLAVAPASIDFVYTSLDDPTRMAVTVSNISAGELWIVNAIIAESVEPPEDGMFFIQEDPAFPPDSGEGVIPPHMALAAGASRTIHVGYVKHGADDREATGQLLVEYRLPGDPSEMSRELRIPLTANRTDSKLCDIAIYDIGAVVFEMILVGNAADKVFRFKNSGTGTCTITAFKLADCVVDNGIDCPDPFTGADSVNFLVSSPASIVGMQVGPGANSDLITLNFPAKEGLLGNAYSAMMSFEARDDNGFLTARPNCGGDTGVNCNDNVSAQTFAGPYVAADHPQFGKVRTGCAVTLKAYMMNDGPAAQLQNIQPGACPASFSVNGLPAPFPVTLSPHQLLSIDVTYQPTAVGQESCAITWTVDGKDIVGTASGEGTEQNQVTDTFVVAEGDDSFDLSGVPRGPIEVSIDGVPCSDNWIVEFPDYNPRAVPGEGCIPEIGDTVTITYSVSCIG